MKLAAILIPYTFLIGACIGSFLNVVIYRLPRGKSLSKPRSQCPDCGRAIPFYLNIPILSWLILGGKCRWCKKPISPRYIVIEAITGFAFAGLFYCYFIANTRLLGADDGVRAFVNGYWWVYILHASVFAAFIAASAIDLELWIIPLSLCWFVTAMAIVFNTIAPAFVLPQILEPTSFLPLASPATAALALGASIGLGVALLLLKKGLIKQSYEGLEEKFDESEENVEIKQLQDELNFNDRREMLTEIVFLMPIAVAALIAYLSLANIEAWQQLCSNIYVKSFLGSVYGYFIGCATVWITRILGTFAFGREAMGLGDVHLMGAAGAAIGAGSVVIAFFIAPFFGLLWAIVSLVVKKNREIPYGPFLSLAVFLVMIFQDAFLERLSVIFGY